MLFDYRYRGESRVASRPSGTAMTFVPDALRKPTHFQGKLDRSIPFREAISALHDVVVSDLRRRPKDRGEYQAWIAEQEQAMLAEYLSHKGEVVARAQEVSADAVFVRVGVDADAVVAEAVPVGHHAR